MPQTPLFSKKAPPALPATKTRVSPPETSLSPLQMEDLEQILTTDGSITFIQKETGWSYRSIHGAQTESTGIFLHGTGLSAQKKRWCVLEFGFGAGTNFLETARAALTQKTPLHFTSAELFLVPSAVISGQDEAAKLARVILDEARVQKSGWICKTSGLLTLEIFVGNWLNLQMPAASVDAIYYDPFGPKDQPEAWSTACFKVAFSALRDDGMLGTYSSASGARRSMQEAGFYVAEAKGPGRKREITFAAKKTKVLDNYKVLSRFSPS